MAISPHVLFESLAYLAGFALLARMRRQDRLPELVRWQTVAAAVIGAAVGSKLLYWFDDPTLTWAHRGDYAFLMGGKSIIGGLAGGLCAVESTKRWIGETRSTGDLLVLPLCVGIAIGRIGCFLAGLPDHTYGIATTLPWGVDLGDGVFRHPTALYESGFALMLAAMLAAWSRGPHRDGDVFRLFMIFYALFRLAIDTIKPDPSIGGLTATQWMAVAILLYYARDIARLTRGYGAWQTN